NVDGNANGDQGLTYNTGKADVKTRSEESRVGKERTHKLLVGATHQPAGTTVDQAALAQALTNIAGAKVMTGDQDMNTFHGTQDQLKSSINYWTGMLLGGKNGDGTTMTDTQRRETVD